MSYIDILKYFLKLLIVIYFSAVIGYSIKFVTSAEKGSLLEIFSPVILFNELISFDISVLFPVMMGVYVFVRWDFLYRTKVDWIYWFRWWS